MLLISIATCLAWPATGFPFAYGFAISVFAAVSAGLVLV
jgi:hypothetical protein